MCLIKKKTGIANACAIKEHFPQCSDALRERVYPCPERQEKFLSVKDTVLASNVEQGADPHHGIPTQQTISSTLHGESVHNSSNPHVQRDNPQRIQNATQKSNSCDRKLWIDTKCKNKMMVCDGTSCTSKSLTFVDRHSKLMADPALGY